MQNCEGHQNLLLDYLFDLLEDGERRALEDHLAGCAACRGALAKNKEQQRLLAAAARLECAGVRFEAPLRAAVAAPRPLPLAALGCPRRVSLGDCRAGCDHRLQHLPEACQGQ
jgi:anti-sigma factor RsiW